MTFVYVFGWTVSQAEEIIRTCPQLVAYLRHFRGR